MSNLSEKFDKWCIVELMGHAKIAGRCTEENLAGVNMLRVDVPETAKHPAFTKFFGGSSIYAVTPVDQNTAILAAQSLESTPVNSWQGSAFLEKYQKLIGESTNDLDDFIPDI